jgi:hypothetical protein
MKVKELINLLQQHNPEFRVVVDGYESGYDDISIREIELALNVNSEWYYGRHESGSEVSAICLSRFKIQ